MPISKCILLAPILLVCFMNPSVVPQAADGGYMGWLRTNGKFIQDSRGNNVILRGANFMGYEFGAWSSHEEADYARLANWGFNVVRLPIAWDYIEPEPGVYNKSYFEQYVDRDVGWARKHGIYIILDMHQYFWSSHFTYWNQGGQKGNGMPSWSVAQYPNTDEGRTQAQTDFWLGKGPNGTEATDKNPSMQDRFVDMWERVALRYANESTIAAYELFNEPHRGNVSRRDHPEYLYAFYEKLIDRIRELDSRHIIIYEHTATFTTQYARLLDHSNLVFSFHFYRLKESYDGNKTLLESLFNLHYDNVKTWNVPILVGEFNIHRNYSNVHKWLKDTLDIFNKYKLSWTWWTYYKSNVYEAALCYRNGTERVEFAQLFCALA